MFQALRFCAALGVVVALSVSLARPAIGQPKCAPLNVDIPIRSTLASASFFANIRNSDDSIRFRMDELLTQAKAAAHERYTQESTCRRDCTNAVVAVLFSSSPNKTLADYDETSTCQQIYEKTFKSPIVYDKRSFDSEDAAKDWYNDLTQGDGTDGEDLYEKCPGKCSPSYSTTAYEDAGKFIVTTSIVCGHARDKDDNQYRLNAALRWICP
jgi:hypothetical protein